MELQPKVAFYLIANLQLAYTHPTNPLKAVAEEIGRKIQSEFNSDSAVYEALELGWHREKDVTYPALLTESNQSKTEIHNVFTLYELDEKKQQVESQLLSFSRPQDWGNRERWFYNYCKIEAGKYICHCHIWQEIHRPVYEACRHIGQYLFMFVQPGTPVQLCGRDYLDEDDFWREEWGKQPEYYYCDDEDYL